MIEHYPNPIPGRDNVRPKVLVAHTALWKSFITSNFTASEKIAHSTTKTMLNSLGLAPTYLYCSLDGGSMAWRLYEADRVVAAVNESHEYFLSDDWEKAIKGIEKRLNS